MNEKFIEKIKNIEYDIMEKNPDDWETFDFDGLKNLCISELQEKFPFFDTGIWCNIVFNHLFSYDNIHDSQKAIVNQMSDEFIRLYKEKLNG